MFDLQLYVLGSPRLERNGQQVTVDRRKALALLVYLSVSGQDQPRDSLATLLWPDDDQTTARAALRRNLYSLNQALGPGLLEAERDTICLRSDRADIWVDANHFQAMLESTRTHGHAPGAACPSCLSTLTQACDLYRDDFLASFSLRNAPDFENWQLLHAEFYRRQLTAALEWLVAGYSALGDFERATDYAQHWLKFDPFSELAHDHLVRLYAWSGQRQAAMRQYHQCARLLERELGISPLASTTETYRAVKTNRPLPVPAPPKPAEATATPADTSFPVPVSTRRRVPSSVGFSIPTDRSPLLDKMSRGRLVGRTAEFAQMQESWMRTVSGERQTLLISGEAGIGKSRLVLEFARWAESQGGMVLAGRCDPVNRVPYAPLAQVIRASFDNFPQISGQMQTYILADLLSLAPQLRPRYPDIPANPPVEPVFERQRVFDSAVSWCEQLSSERPTILLVEDIHWGDSGTLQLLHHMLGHMRAGNLLSILTLRETESDTTEEQILHQILQDLQRERLAVSLNLQRFDRNHTSQMLAAFLETEDEISTEFLNSIYRETEGNPFYVEEVCKALIEEGKLFFAGGVWQRMDIETIVIPKSVRSAILSRVEKLDLRLQEMLHLAAVLGQEGDIAVLQSMGDWDEMTLERMLEQAERARFLQETVYGSSLRFAFSHALIPFTLRENLSRLRLRHLHRRAAEVILASQPDGYEMLVHHYTAAGEQEKAVTYMLRAAKKAQSLYDYNSALQHLYAALNVNTSASSHPAARLALLEQLADVHRLLGERTEAISHYQEALDEWRGQPEKDRWSAVRLHHKIGEAYLHLTEKTEVDQYAPIYRGSMENGLHLAAGQPPHPETVRLLTVMANDAWESLKGQDWQTAEVYAREAIAMAEQLDMPVEQSIAVEALSTVYGVRGMLRERVELALKRITLSRDPRFIDLREQNKIFTQAGAALIQVGEFDQAMALLLEAERLARYVHDINQEIFALSQQAQCYYSLDRWDEMLEIEHKWRSMVALYGVARVDRMCYYCGLSANVNALLGNMEQARYYGEIAYNNMSRSIKITEDKWPRSFHY